MRDVFQAIEHLSALLARQIAEAAARRGWATRTATRPLPAGRERTIQVVSATLELPQGVAATFTPRPEPSDGGWCIDVARSDGVRRRRWAEGLRVAPGPGGFALLGADGPFGEEALEALLSDLARPGPSGVALWVRKVWAIRFGRLPLDLSELLDRDRDADRLDAMHAAVLRSLDAQDAASQLRRIAHG